MARTPEITAAPACLAVVRLDPHRDDPLHCPDDDHYNDDDDDYYDGDNDDYDDDYDCFGLVTNAVTCTCSHAPAFGRSPGLRPDTYFVKTKLLGTTNYTAQKNIVMITNYLDYLRSFGLVTNPITCTIRTRCLSAARGLRPHLFLKD